MGVHTDVRKEQSSKVDVYDLQLPDKHGKIISASNLVWILDQTSWPQAIQWSQPSSEPAPHEVSFASCCSLRALQARESSANAHIALCANFSVRPRRHMDQVV